MSHLRGEECAFSEKVDFPKTYFKLSYWHNAEAYDASQFIIQTGYYQYFCLVLVQSTQRKGFFSIND